MFKHLVLFSMIGAAAYGAPKSVRTFYLKPGAGEGNGTESAPFDVLNGKSASFATEKSASEQK